MLGSMLISMFYILLAISGLSFLVFIHELGHYWIAKREGMKIEAFSIGFGKPMIQWQWKGVQWKICWLPFGGYVKIAGMQQEGSRDLYEIEGGFFQKKPMQRVRVALAGPMANFAFALVAFFAIWAMGGREKHFADLTHHIGWVDPKSKLYECGIRPGDLIEKYDGKDFQGFRDLEIAALMNDESSRVQGLKVDYHTGKSTAFDYTLPTYDHPAFSKEKLATIGIFSPARYLIYDPTSHPLSESILESGIEAQDRLLFADGEWLFSLQQLSALINESTAFLTVQRGSEIFHTKVPRVSVGDLKLTSFERDELDDWQHAALLKGRLSDLYFIPYFVSYSGVIEGAIDFIEKNDEIRAFRSCQRCLYYRDLQPRDQILAVDGIPVATAYGIMDTLQERRILIIVQRDPSLFSKKILWTEADRAFDEEASPQHLNAIVAALGIGEGLNVSGDLHLLKPIVPKSLSQLNLPAQQRALLDRDIEMKIKEIDAMSDPEKKKEALAHLQKSLDRLILGIPLLKDREVIYNPTPWSQFGEAFHDTERTLVGLLSGYFHPKHMSGPVGIVSIVHHSWMMGPTEALFWMGVISLNLGFLNLLPIPLLDGGHIAFSLYEKVTRRRISGKIMDRLILPFVGLLIFFFVYITYQDISRLFHRFF